MSDGGSAGVDNAQSVKARVKEVSDMLQHPQDYDQASAFERLLIALEQDSSPEVRSIAALSLSQFDGPRAMGPLITALDDPDAKVRRNAALGISRSPDERTFYPLLHALKDPSRGVRVAAVEALGALGEKSALDQIAALLSDDDIAVRRSVLRALSQIDALPSVAVTIELLRGQFDWRGRSAVLRGYCARLPERDLPQLVGYLAHGDEEIREMVAIALRDEERAIPALVAALPESAARERLVIIDLLVQLGRIGRLSMDGDADAPEVVTAALRNLTTDPDDAVRAASVEGLGRLQARREIHVLLHSLADPASRVRLAAAWALHALADARLLDDARATTGLRALLDDPDAAVRLSAASLWHSDSQDIVASLGRELYDPDTAPAERRTAVRILRRFGLRIDDINPPPLPIASIDAVLPQPNGEDGRTALPAALRDAVDTALASVQAHPKHHLAAALRRPIYDGLGSQLDPAAHWARGVLSTWSARHVLALAEDTDPWAWHEIVDMIEMAEDVLTGTIVRGEAEDHLCASQEGQWFVPDVVGPAVAWVTAAAHQALGEVLGHNGLNRLDASMHVHGDDVTGYTGDRPGDGGEQDTHDAAGAAATAMAVVWDGEASDDGVCDDARYDLDPNRLREFWEWWLTRAVPAAWAAREGYREWE